MWIIMISLLIGLGLGYFDFLPAKLNKITDYLVFGGLFLLIFNMGIQIGANPEVIKNLGQLGLEAVMLAAGAVTGSLVTMLTMEYYWEE